jgi:hypothetical protein
LQESRMTAHHERPASGVEARPARRLVLHIGAPKTGSTALQKFLFDNRDALRGHGWTYPPVSLRGYGHHDLAFLIAGGYPEWATPQDTPLSTLVAQLAEALAGDEHVVLSSENFYLLADPQRVARTLADAGLTSDRRVSVVVYVRRQDEAQISWYNQIVKAQGFSGTMADSLSQWDALWDYAAVLERWAAVFGADTVVVRPYQAQDMAGGDIRQDFVRLVGLPGDAFAYPEEAVNTRLNRDVLEFQRLVNRLPLTIQEKRRFHRELMELTTAAAGSALFADAPLLSADDRRAILDRYAPGNARVAQRYLDRPVLFDGTLPPSPPGEDTKAFLDLEKMVYVMGWIIARSR